MWGMAQHSMTLFFQGKLFADPFKVYRRLGIGVVVTATLLIIVAKAGAPVWSAALIAGVAGGALQPYLFKDLRYR